VLWLAATFDRVALLALIPLVLLYAYLCLFKSVIAFASVLGWLSGYAALQKQIRTPELATRVVAGAWLAAICSYGALYLRFSGDVTADLVVFIELIGVSRTSALTSTYWTQAITLLLMVGASYSLAWPACRYIVQRHPFCEACNRVLREVDFELIPLSDQDTLMGMLHQRRFAALRALSSNVATTESGIIPVPEVVPLVYMAIFGPKDSLGWLERHVSRAGNLEVQAFYCDRCRASGVINAKVMQPRDTVEPVRQVYSSPLTAPEITALAATLSCSEVVLG
jgi:hypothetical protein